jgi:hypothetical protein
MWNLITDFPAYRIHDTGLIESCYKPKSSIQGDMWREVKPIYDKSCGYLIVTLCHKGVRKNKRIHRLLMEAFVSNPRNCAHINHIDADKLNNNLSNLEWCTPKENSQHALKAGLYQATFDAQSVAVQMFDLQNTYLLTHSSLHEAERATGVCWQNIWKVCNKRRHTAGGFKWRYAA